MGKLETAMSPDEIARITRLEARMGDLEREVQNRLGRVEGEVINLKEIVHTLAPLTAQTAVLASSVQDLDGDMKRVEAKFDGRLDRIEGKLDDERRERERLQRAAKSEADAYRSKRDDDERVQRRWRVGLIVVVVLGVFSSLMSVVVALAVG
jgi:chromosome segregation ATPase